MDDGKANALSPAMLTELDAALERAEGDDDTHAVLLHGRPGRLSAGFDLSVMTGGLDAMRDLVTQGAELLIRLFTSPLPIVVAGTGHALAAGALLLLAADQRVGADGDFKIGLNEVAIGMALPIFAVELARHRLATTHFDAATMQARIYDPTGAVEAGYLDRVVDAGQVMDEALADATRLGALRAGAFRLTKEHAHRATATLIRDTLAGDMASLGPPAAPPTR
jgi:enoyl-CoA hydratase